MLVLDYIFYFIREYRVLTCLALFVLWIVLLLTSKPRPAGPGKAKRALRWLIPGFILTIFFFGRLLSRAYVLHFGQEGSGVVTGFEPTLVSVGKRRVLAYQTVLQLRNGATHLTSFDDQSAAVYGANEPFWYPTPVPQVGEEFAVRYLPRLPANFLIMANDQRRSFGQRIRCLACEPELHHYRLARQAFQVAPANAGIRARLLSALDEVLACTCLNEAEKQEYQRIRRQAAAGQPVSAAY